MKKIFPWAIIAVVVVFLLGVSVTLIMQTNALQKKLASAQKENLTPQDQTSGWNFYNNKEVSISFKYPQNWTIQEQFDTKNVQEYDGKEYNKSIVNVKAVDDGAGSLSFVKNFQGGIECYEDIPDLSKNITIASGQQLDRSVYKVPEEEPCGPLSEESKNFRAGITSIAFSDINIMYNYNVTKMQEALSIIDLILSTLRLPTEQQSTSDIDKLRSSEKQNLKTYLAVQVNTGDGEEDYLIDTETGEQKTLLPAGAKILAAADSHIIYKQNNDLFSLNLVTSEKYSILKALGADELLDIDQTDGMYEEAFVQKSVTENHKFYIDIIEYKNDSLMEMGMRSYNNRRKYSFDAGNNVFDVREGQIGAGSGREECAEFDSKNQRFLWWYCGEGIGDSLPLFTTDFYGDHYQEIVSLADYGLTADDMGDIGVVYDSGYFFVFKKNNALTAKIIIVDPSLEEPKEEVYTFSPDLQFDDWLGGFRLIMTDQNQILATPVSEGRYYGSVVWKFNKNTNEIEPARYDLELSSLRGVFYSGNDRYALLENKDANTYEIQTLIGDTEKSLSLTTPNNIESVEALGLFMLPEDIVIDETLTWNTYENEELGISFKYPSDFGDFSLYVENGESGKKYYGVFAESKKYFGIGGITSDYGISRSRWFSDFSKYLELEEEGQYYYVSTSLKSLVEPEKIINLGGQKVLIVNRDSFVEERNAEGPVFNPGVNGGALINLPGDSEFKGLAIWNHDINILPQEKFEQIVSTLKFLK